jgi:protein-S-isoprenylcysteine O-methyltransferase Ste14
MTLFLKNLAFAIVVPGTVAIGLPVYIGGGLDAAARFGVRQLLAMPLLAAGLVTIVLAIGFFGTTGRGTPAPFDPPSRLVIRGPHRFVRNPMYAGVVITVLGWAIWFASWSLVLYAGIAWVFFHTFVTLVEEPGLKARFGDDYAAYCRAVRRWIPGPTYAARSG